MRGAPSLRHPWRGPLLALVAGGMVGAAVASVLPDRYRAEARILNDAGQPGWASPAPPTLNGRGPSGEAPRDRENGPTVVYVDILRSRTLAERLLNQRYLYGLRTWRHGPRLIQDGTLAAYLGARSPDAGAAALATILSIQRDGRSGLLRVRAETRSPELSLALVQEAVAGLRERLADLGQEGGRARARASREHLDGVRREVDRRLHAFRAFQEANRAWETSAAPNLRLQGVQLREDLALWRQLASSLTLSHEQALLELRGEMQALLVLDPGALPSEPSGPPRVLIAFASAATAGGAGWALTHRSRIRDLLLRKDIDHGHQDA